MKRILSLLAASALLLSLCPAGFASEDTLFWEDFEEQGFVSDDPNGESAWYSNSSGFLEDSDIFHDGSKSLAIKDGSPVIEYRGDKICGNYVYEF